MEANIVELNNDEICNVSGGDCLDLCVTAVIIFGFVTVYGWPKQGEIDSDGFESIILDHHGYYQAETLGKKAVALLKYVQMPKHFKKAMIAFGVFVGIQFIFNFVGHVAKRVIEKIFG